MWQRKRSETAMPAGSWMWMEGRGLCDMLQGQCSTSQCSVPVGPVQTHTRPACESSAQLRAQHQPPEQVLTTVQPVQHPELRLVQLRHQLRQQLHRVALGHGDRHRRQQQHVPGLLAKLSTQAVTSCSGGRPWSASACSITSSRSLLPSGWRTDQPQQFRVGRAPPPWPGRHRSGPWQRGTGTPARATKPTDHGSTPHHMEVWKHRTCLLQLPAGVRRRYQWLERLMQHPWRALIGMQNCCSSHAGHT